MQYNTIYNTRKGSTLLNVDRISNRPSQHVFYTATPPYLTPEDAGVLVEITSSVSPACRKRRLMGRRYIAIVADTA